MVTAAAAAVAAVCLLSMQDIKQQVLSYLQEHLSLDPVTFDLLPPVYLHTSHIDDATYFRLYTSCDCVVLPTRSVLQDVK